jgi:hypothetical protein
MYGFDVVTKPSCASAVLAASIPPAKAVSCRMWSFIIGISVGVVLVLLVSAENMNADCFRQAARG